MTEMELIQAAASGNEAANQALVGMHLERLVQAIKNRVACEHDAREIAATAITRGLRSLLKFRGDSGFYSYLYRIALNLTKNYYRRREAKMAEHHDSIEASGIDAYGIQVEDAAMQPDQAAHWLDVRHAIMEALMALPDMYRQPLMMYADGTKYDSIAASLNLPLGTVRSRISRAREIMRKTLNITIGEIAI